MATLDLVAVKVPFVDRNGFISEQWYKVLASALQGTVSTGELVNDAVTFAKMQNISTDRLIGRDTAGTGDPEQISLNSTLEFTGSGSIQRAALTGDVTASAGSNSTTLANTAVTPGNYTNTNLTVDSKGRITAASNGSTGGVNSGTSFPGSPSNNDLYYRTDLDWLCFYDSGTSTWMTVNQFMMPFSAYTAFASNVTATNTGLMNANIPFVATYNLYLQTAYVTTYVATTNNGTHNWTVDITKFPATGAGTSLGSFSTSGDTASNFTQHTITINAALGTTFFWIVLGATKVNSPGGFYSTASISYRIIVT